MDIQEERIEGRSLIRHIASDEDSESQSTIHRDSDSEKIAVIESPIHKHFEAKDDHSGDKNWGENISNSQAAQNLENFSNYQSQDNQESSSSSESIEYNNRESSQNQAEEFPCIDSEALYFHAKSLESKLMKFKDSKKLVDSLSAEVKDLRERFEDWAFEYQEYQPKLIDSLNSKIDLIKESYGKHKKEIKKLSKEYQKLSEIRKFADENRKMLFTDFNDHFDEKNNDVDYKKLYLELMTEIKNEFNYHAICELKGLSSEPKQGWIFCKNSSNNAKVEI